MQAVIDDEGGRRMRIGAPFEGLDHGQSISVSGVCLTVEKAADGEWFEVFLARKPSPGRSSIISTEATGKPRTRDPADDRFDGHIVQGHVVRDDDGTSSDGDDWTFEFDLPESLGTIWFQKGR